MKAEEAKRKALEFNTNETNSEYKKIMDSIISHSSRGDYECFFYSGVKPDVRKKLVEEGYIVYPSQSGGPNETMTKITWSGKC